MPPVSSGNIMDITTRRNNIMFKINVPRARKTNRIQKKRKEERKIFNRHGQNKYMEIFISTQVMMTKTMV
jgi:hypothetical protein